MKKSKEKKFIQIILISIIFISIAITAFNVLNLAFTKTVKGSRYDSYKNKYYVIGKQPTDYQIEVFKELTTTVDKKDIDEEKMADLVAQSFVIDFFGWSNKEGAYDVGGLQYMHDPDDFYEVAHYEYYQLVDVFNEVYSSLPSVKDVSSHTQRSANYQIEDKSYPAYKSTVTFHYEDSQINPRELINQVEITSIINDGRAEIVTLKMVDEESEVEIYEKNY